MVDTCDVSILSGGKNIFTENFQRILILNTNVVKFVIEHNYIVYISLVFQHY